MKLKPHRWKFSHPDIAICPKRLQMILAAGAAADQALGAPHLGRAFEAANPGEKIDAGGRQDLVSRRDKLAARYERLRERSDVPGAKAELTQVKADLDQATEALKAYTAGEDAERQRILAISTKRNRCVSYALECGLRTRDTLKFEGKV